MLFWMNLSNFSCFFFFSFFSLFFFFFFFWRYYFSFSFNSATHNYNETNKILAGPLISLVALFLFHCSGYYNAFGQAIGEKNTTTLHNTSMNKMNNIKSMRIILMFSSCCICYVQSSSLLKVLHGTYQYFERLTKLVELFTLSSKHPSWYSFFRRFARYEKKIFFFPPKKRDLSFFFYFLISTSFTM